jgi:hypothetical protein
MKFNRASREGGASITESNYVERQGRQEVRKLKAHIAES